jgi:glycosyltransferase involved in cell wall biosynthesis
MAQGSIVFVINSLTAGGAEGALVDLLTYLEQPLRAYTVHLVLLDVEEELHAAPPWVEKHYLNAKFSFIRSTVLLARLLRELAPAVAISFLNRANCANVITAKLARHPCIISERTHPTTRFRTGLEAMITKAIMRLTYPLADHVIAVSEGVREDLIESFGVPRAKTRVIYNPIDVDAIGKKALEAPSIRLVKPYIISVGRLVPSKNFRLLIKAYRATAVTEDLVIVGEGEERRALEELASSLGLEGRVILPGHVQNPYPLVAAARLFVSSSNLEGFPNALIEAMALGCPVVATDCDTGPMEILMGKRQARCTEVMLAEYGLLVPVESAVLLAEAIRIGGTENVRGTYSQRARERARDFGIRRSVDQYWSVIASCAGPVDPVARDVRVAG